MEEEDDGGVRITRVSVSSGGGDGEGFTGGERGEGSAGVAEGPAVVGVSGGEVVECVDGLLHEAAAILAPPHGVLRVQF